MALPISLKILAAVLAVLFILLFVIKKKNRKFIRVIIILTAGTGVWYGLKLYNKKNPDYLHVKADIKISAVDLIYEYEAGDSASDQKHLGKLIETEGNIKKIEKDEKGYYTVVLGDTSSLSSVRCSMDTVHNADAAHLTAGSSVILRGVCTGFNKDEMGLGSDVILNRCAVIAKKD